MEIQAMISALLKGLVFNELSSSARNQMKRWTVSTLNYKRVSDYWAIISVIERREYRCKQ